MRLSDRDLARAYLRSERDCTEAMAAREFEELRRFRETAEFLFERLERRGLADRVGWSG